MKSLRSIKFRLVVLYWLLSNALLLTVFGIIYYRLQREIDKIDSARLKEEAHEFVKEEHTTVESLVQFARHSVQEENRIFRHPWLFFCACDMDGREIVRSNNVPQGRMLASQEGFELAKSAGKSTETIAHVSKYPVMCRSTRLPLADGTTCIAQIGISQMRKIKTLDNFIDNICIAFGAFAAVSVVLGFLLVKWSFDPVNRITETAQSITAHDLSRRIPVPGTEDEIARLSRAFNAMIERLEDSFKREHEFSAHASHELRTPVSVMRGQLELALESERTAEEYRQVLASCLEELDKLRAIAESLLLLAKHDHDSVGPKRESVRLSGILEEVCDIGRTMGEERGVQVRLNGPAEAGDACVWANRESVERLFINLMENAIRYNKPNGAVTVSLQVQDEKAVVEIRDTGIGIAQEDMPFIFERFYRAKEAPPEATGAGLGLSICKAVVEEHGGVIAAESAPGEGSTFTVTLPLEGRHRDMARP